MMPPEEVKKKLIGQWLHKAGQDIAAAEVLLRTEPPFLYPACFHAQQAAEKYLKAFLTQHQVEFPKTHDVKELLVLVAKVDEALSSRLQDTTALTRYGVDIRYPQDEPEPNLDEARTALELARKVREAVTKCLRNGGIQEVSNDATQDR